MKKFVLVNLLFLFLLVSPTFSLEACAEEPASLIKEIEEARIEFEQEQFLVEIQKNGNKEMVELYLFIIDHSVYKINTKTWNIFVKNYKNCFAAYRAYKQGWNIQFDDLLY